MAVSDITVILLLGTLINYELIYRRNNLFGNIIFLGLGLVTYSLSTSVTYSLVGTIFLVGSLMGIIYDLIKINKKADNVQTIE